MAKANDHLHILTTSTSSPVPMPASLIASIERAATGALQADFVADPLLGPGLSLCNSYLSSVVKRHGGLLDAAVCEGLERSGEYLVLRQVEMPITDAAESIVATNTPESLVGLTASAHGPYRRVAIFDLIAIHLTTGAAKIIEIKRGGGETEVRKRRLIERDLRCARLQLPSFLRPRFDCEPRSYESWLLDYYGRSGFSDGLTVTREGIDTMFGVPVRQLVDAVTDRLRVEVFREVPRLLTIAQNILLAADDGSLQAHPFANPVKPKPAGRQGVNDNAVAPRAKARGKASRPTVQ
ncbi:hypothetical protein [Bosea sp. 124]|uniref:hypothetical protein n=1 Tax=Bosea sp. 124 TaxID=2135642 RepID=UPI000D3DAA7F|nr:hypothetical protein [Bosea sp. 124]PTM41620.1 hypothetical protein C8D03_3187 [Bosea sp. 124]